MSKQEAQTTRINCPECGAEIDVNEVLSHKMERDFQARRAEERKQLAARESELAKLQQDLDTRRKELKLEIEAGIADREKDLRRTLTEKLRSTLETEQAEARKLLETELNEKTEKIREMNRLATENEQLKRKQSELAGEMEARFEARLTEEREGLVAEMREKHELQLREFKQKLEDQEKLTAEMRRKQAQGSMQLQGEVQELAIEDHLRDAFPLDIVEEIRKGTRGGDCIQIVNIPARQNCGTIYYESKRTKHFQPAWIEKFKTDMRERSADAGVLVTDALPAGMDRMGLSDGIWICRLHEFKILCQVLRDAVVRIGETRVAQENSTSKMGMLYTYLTSNEFRMQMEAIVDGFTQMRLDLESEKRALTSAWKTREKQIEKVTLNTSQLYGAIKGIAGAALPEVKNLELPAPEEE